MTGMRERIAGIIAEHTHSDETFRYCYCGFSPETGDREWFDVWSEHLADMLTTELGLRQEWTWAWTRTSGADSELGYGLIVDTRQEAEDEGPGCTAVTRYVAEWQADD